jgi:hypothetical protein
VVSPSISLLSYTCVAKPAGKSLRRVACMQLVAAQDTELLNGYDTIIVHGSIKMRLVLLPSV